jgi:hypothetical protein
VLDQSLRGQNAKRLAQGVRDTPSRSQSARSLSRVPGASTPSVISSRS